MDGQARRRWNGWTVGPERGLEDKRRFCILESFREWNGTINRKRRRVTVRVPRIIRNETESNEHPPAAHDGRCLGTIVGPGALLVVILH